ncbi:integrin alpha-4-like protein [Dinothrombium tinctorium]|uniref:Integrin alpha-4-like protein n=1 Tax=Dinothrombium tinctorium TaxID=1965070 RepID=A0A443QTC0_9ACAR|nr:integrin alpha-4-like protein [Dinothrombium tinctorium]
MIAIGAPGFSDWQGSVVIYNKANFATASILFVDHNYDKDFNTIMGYSVAIGQFFYDKVNYIATGAPRSKETGSLASIGDLNYDGFKDIAVGAPYENEGHGAVYIYHGTRFGLSKNYIQRIAAADQLSAFKLRGFGLSIATGHDVDNNDYPDLLIGSYMSDKAVLLRSRPVMSIKLSIKFNLHKSSEEIAQIDLKNQNCQLNSILYSCFDVVYCLHLKGEYLPKIQNVIVSFEIDSKLKRRGFVKVDENKLHQFNREANVSTKSNQCLEPISIYLDVRFVVFKCFQTYNINNQPKTEDKLTPMSISLSAKLNKEEQKSEFCKECPILSNEASISRNLDFETGCGIDQHCTADLRLDVRSNLSFILQGLNTEFPLYVQITNKGENAYSTKLQLAIQPAIDVNQISSYCEEHIEHEMVKINCDINNPLEEEQSKEIFFLLGLSKLSSTTQSITVDANVTTPSKSFSLKCEYLNSNLPMLPEDLTSDDESEESDVEMGNLKMKEEKVSRREAKLNEDDFNANTTAEKEPMLKLVSMKKFLSFD